MSSDSHGVLFDIDNTLYHYAPAHKAAMEAVANKADNLLGLEKSDFHEGPKILLGLLQVVEHRTRTRFWLAPDLI